MLAVDIPALLHIAGYLTGATLYAMLLAMALSTQSSESWLAVVTAFLGLTWNVGELSMRIASNLEHSLLASWLAAASYGALGLLAAVVVHSVSEGAVDDSRLTRCLRRLVLALAYGSAGLATVVHGWTAVVGASLPSTLGLTINTAGLLGLSVPLALVTRGQATQRRALWTVALAAFGVSALHVAQFHGTNEPWTMELLGHHASIPLAFALLYEDYRFALADLFLKHALTLLMVVAVVVGSYALVVLPLGIDGGALPPSAVAVLLALWCTTSLAFPWIRRAADVFVDRVVLRRADYAALLDRLSVDVEGGVSVDGVLNTICRALGPALSARRVTWRSNALDPSAPLEANAFAVWTVEPPHFVLTVETLTGGRRLLSDDLVLLERVSTIAARRIDALRLSEERYERMLREREIQTLATEAELRTLRAQINPHFLFNALTAIGYLIQSQSPRALDTLLRLTTLLRSVLRSTGEFTTLGRERELVDCYLSIERERFEERLEIELDIPEQLCGRRIPSLIVQPLVENAIKHGIAESRGGGLVSIAARLRGAELVISVRNTGARRHARRQAGRRGLGLANVERRLELHYGDAASVSLMHGPDGTSTAMLRLPAQDLDRADVAAATRSVAP